MGSGDRIKFKKQMTSHMVSPIGEKVIGELTVRPLILKYKRD